MYAIRSYYAKFPDASTVTTNSQRYALGMEITPNDRSAKSYLARVRYRMGGYYLKDYLVLNDYQLKDVGISFGMGLPLKRSKTSINLAIEYGQKGTTDYRLIKETYTRFTLNLTLHEYWFAKSKFD